MKYAEVFAHAMRVYPELTPEEMAEASRVTAWGCIPPVHVPLTIRRRTAQAVPKTRRSRTRKGNTTKG